MADLPGPHAALPHTPGAHHVPKWAWIAGGAGIVGGVALFHHRQSAAAAADSAAMNDPGTAGFNAGAVDSAVANPNGDPNAGYVPNGSYYPLPTGSAPIVIGDPPPPDSGIVAPDTPGTAQLPPIIGNLQIGPITGNPDPQAAVTGGGAPSGTGPRNPKPSMTHHGATNLKPLHDHITAKGPGVRAMTPKPKKPKKGKGGPAGGKPLSGGGGGGGGGQPGPQVTMQTAPVVAPKSAAPVTTSPAPGVPALTPGAQHMPVTGGGLPGSGVGLPMTPVPVSIPAPAPPKMVVMQPMAPPTLAVPPPQASAAPPPSVTPPAMIPATTQAQLSQSRNAATASRETVAMTPARPIIQPKKPPPPPPPKKKKK